MFAKNKKGPTRLNAKITAYMDQYENDPHEALAFQIIAALRKSGRLGEAFKWAKHARQSFPESKRALKLYRQLKQRHTAESLKQAKTRAKRNPTAENLVRYSELLRISGKNRKAYKVARKAEAQNANHWQVLLSIGKLHFDRFSSSRTSDDGWNAVEYLDRSRCANSKNYSTLILLVITLTRLGSFDDAQGVLDEVLAIAPNDQRALSLKKRLDAALSQEGRGDSGQRALGNLKSSGDIARVLELSGCVGVVSFTEDGQVEESCFKGTNLFNLDVPTPVFEAMAKACHLDTQRIGFGDLSSCALSGNNWAIDFHVTGEKPVLGFFEGQFTPDQVEASMESAVRDVARA